MSRNEEKHNVAKGMYSQAEEKHSYNSGVYHEMHIKLT